jgi:KamA family protein
MIWKNELKKSIQEIESLNSYLEISTEEERKLKEVIETHPMRITRYYLSLIDWDDPEDPIRKMVVPSADELVDSGSYDTSGENQSTKMPGLQHKYEQTALILATSRCPTYCRHCFRKRLVGLPTDEVLRRFNEAAQYIERHPKINNVLISGGDPLILGTATIEKFLRKLSSIPHISYIRFGSRVPVVFPDRILQDRELLDVLRRYSGSGTQIFVSTQFNHPREITSQSTNVVHRLLRSGVILNNQAVLLRGVNDRSDTLANLQMELVRIGVNPYYVFQCRPVKRVKHHFQVPLSRGCRIVRNAQQKLDGYSKRFRYVMSHLTGKIEILGILEDRILLRYHQARNAEDVGKLFTRRLDEHAAWLDELEDEFILESWPEFPFKKDEFSHN